MDKGTEMLSGHMAIVVEAFRGATVEVDGHELPVTLEKILADDAGFRAVVGAPSPNAIAAAKHSQVPRHVLAMEAEGRLMMRSVLTMTPEFIEEVCPRGEDTDAEMLRVMFGILSMPDLIREKGRGFFMNAPCEFDHLPRTLCTQSLRLHCIIVQLTWALCWRAPLPHPDAEPIRPAVDRDSAPPWE